LIQTPAAAASPDRPGSEHDGLAALSPKRRDAVRAATQTRLAAGSDAFSLEAEALAVSGLL
jgi:hypothetical protein